MPRGPRMIQNDSYYHIVTRGNNKKKIFRYTRDYIFFKKVVKSYLQKYPLYIYHYCLMNNHPHFLVKTIEAQAVPKFFQAILQVYACYFRHRYGHTGFLFQNRYKNYLIDKESYLLDCARYIERNPLRAKITDSLDNFQWSSYPYYAEGRTDEIIAAPDPFYVQLAGTDEERRRKYREYVLQERPYDLIVDKGLRIG